MNYRLRKAVIGRVPEIAITAARFAALRQARKVLVEAFALEEKYEILLSNFIALEQEVLSRAATELVRHSVEYYDFYESRLLFNVRLVNLLTAARLYVDRVPAHLRDCDPENESATADARTLLSSEYERNPAYRFMEALRNHVQHNGVPVHKLSVGGSRFGEPPNDYIESGISLFALKRYLAEDRDFKGRILDECPEEIDLMTAARAYMESLSRIHAEGREKIELAVNRARQLVEEAQAEYTAANTADPERNVGLEAQALADGKVAERIPLLLDWDDVRVRLQARNRAIRNLTRRYVTGRSKMPE